MNGSHGATSAVGYSPDGRPRMAHNFVFFHQFHQMCVNGVAQSVGLIRHLRSRGCPMRALLVFGLLLLVADSRADELSDVVLNVGDTVAEFQARDEKGDIWRSSDHVGKKMLVVYFYPADLTGGCTKQACGFRDDSAALEKAGIAVVGVSGDSPENHQLFRRVHGLNFTLLADEDGKVARTFGVPVREGATIMKTIDGVEKTLIRGVTASRWTYVIGLDGRIVYKNTTVDAAADSQNVLKAVGLLSASTR